MVFVLVNTFYRTRTKSTDYKKQDKRFNEALALGGTAIIALGVANSVENHFNQNPLWNVSCLMGAIGGIGYLGFNGLKNIQPFWKEVTEYRPDTPPFSTRRSLNLIEI